MAQIYFPSSSQALAGLERARQDLMSAIDYTGAWPRSDAQTPTKLLRAFFGPRWVSRDVIDLDDCMIEEATEFLHRMALEMRMQGPARSPSGASPSSPSHANQEPRPHSWREGLPRTHDKVAEHLRFVPSARS